MDFTPIPIAATSPLRRALLPFAPVIARLLRALWSCSPKSRSTWFDSRLWRAIWNINRWFACTPRADPTAKITRLSPDVTMELDLPRLTDVLAWCYGVGEMEVGYLCRRLCSQDAVVVDVGGNVGTTTLAFASHVRSGHVHVFEPSPQMLPHLRRNLELSGLSNVTVHALGLSDSLAHGRLRTAIAGNPGSAHFVLDANEQESPEIEVARLDDVLGDLPRVDLIKIDVEGLEFRVLVGAEAVLHRCQPIVIFEVNEPALARGGTSSEAILEHLRQRGYAMAWVEAGQLRPYADAGSRRHKLHNVIALPGKAQNLLAP